MAKEVEVVFIKEKKGHFQIGQTKSVKYGYAFNYLLPFKWAVENNKANKSLITATATKANSRQKELKTEAKKIEAILNNKTVTFNAKAHDEGRLYGSISITDLVNTINATFETTLDKHDIKGFTPIKEIGDYTASIAIHSDIQITVNILVEEEKTEEINKPGQKKTKKGSNETGGLATYADDETTNSKETDSSLSTPLDDQLF